MIAAGGTLSVARIVAERDRVRAASEELLVDRARSLTAVDPTSAVAVLRDLPAASSRWPIAREVVRAAMAGGVERLIARHPSRILGVAFSPNGRLASASFTNGVIQVHDLALARGLARGTTTTVSATGATRLGWLDERVLVASTSEAIGDHTTGTIRLIDTDTHRETRLPITAFDDVAYGAGRAVVRLPGGRVVAYGADGNPVTLADAGVAAIDARGGRVVMLSRERMIVVDRDGTRHERAVEIPTRVLEVRSSASGDRVAALASGSVYEWAMTSDDPPRTWPRTASNGIVYGGERLYTWSNDGTGVAACEPDRLVTRWLARLDGTIGLVPSEVDAAVMFATPQGRFAHAGPTGLIELAHRPEPVSRIALDPTGRRVAVGTDDGEVELLELGPTLPEVHELERGARLLAIGRDRMVVGRNVFASPEIVELDTARHHPIDVPAEASVAAFVGNAVVAFGGNAAARVAVVTDLDGKVRYHADRIGSAAIRRDLTFATVAGDIVSVPLPDVDRAHVIAHFEPRSIALLDQAPTGDVVVVLIAPGSAWPTFLVDAAGSRPFELATTGMPDSFLEAGDGTWWSVVNYRELWRRPRDGAPARIPLDSDVQEVLRFGDHVIAHGSSTTYELAADGRVLRTSSSLGADTSFDDGLLLATPAGVVAATPVANVRRLLAAGATVSSVRGHPTRARSAPSSTARTSIGSLRCGAIRSPSIRPS